MPSIQCTMTKRMQSLKSKHVYLLVADYSIGFTLLFWDYIAFIKANYSMHVFNNRNFCGITMLIWYVSTYPDNVIN